MGRTRKQSNVQPTDFSVVVPIGSFREGEAHTTVLEHPDAEKISARRPSARNRQSPEVQGGFTEKDRDRSLSGP